MSCVLILEDDEISARLAARMLSTRGNEVHTAANSTSAWSLLQEKAVDVLVLDSELENEHGWEFLARIRADVIFKELPVIVYSSVARRDVVQRYLALGAQGILVKPTTADRLNQEVGRLTERPWRDRLFEKLEAVQARTGLMHSELMRLGREAAEELSDALPEINSLVENTASPAGMAKVTAMKSCALNIGFLRLAEIFEGIQKAVAAQDAARTKLLVERLPTALRLLTVQTGGSTEVAPPAPEQSMDPVPNAPPVAAAAPAAAVEPEQTAATS